MIEEYEISSSDDSENLSDNFENDFDNEETSLEDKWVFPKASDHLAMVLPSGAVRPLSPTLKVHSPESVFPGVAMLYEGFDDMREWKNTIEFVRFFTKKGNMFNNRHHWDMRTKFLEVRLRSLDKIAEDPCGVHRKPVGGFFVRVPLELQKTLEEEKKTELAREWENTGKKEHVTDEAYIVEQEICAKKEPNNIDRKLCVKEQVNAGKQNGINENNVDIKNCLTQQMFKDKDCEIENNNLMNDEFSSLQKDFTSTRNTRKTRKKIDIWIPNPNDCVDDSSMYMMENCNLNNEQALSANTPEVTLEMLRKQRQLEKESSKDEKLKRESLQKGINFESRQEISATSAKCERFSVSNDSIQDLKVIGKSIASFIPELVDNDNESGNIKELNSETSSSKVGEMVLEDINDKDVVSNLILPSPCKFERTTVEDVKTATPTVSTTEARENLVEQNTTDRRILSRLRRRIRNLFSCFTRNKVTPIDI